MSDTLEDFRSLWNLRQMEEKSWLDWDKKKHTEHNDSDKSAHIFNICTLCARWVHLCWIRRNAFKAFKHRPAGEALSGGHHSFLREKTFLLSFTSLIFCCRYEPTRFSSLVCWSTEEVNNRVDK